MDNSVGLSSGIALHDPWNHPNLGRMTVDGERFHPSPVEVHSALAFHAAAI
jgi:hypothetical protein